MERKSDNARSDKWDTVYHGLQECHRMS
jgi:hypothetical protein